VNPVALLDVSRHRVVGGEELRLVRRLGCVMDRTQQLGVDRIVVRRRRPADRREQRPTPDVVYVKVVEGVTAWDRATLTVFLDDLAP
jgi:hypothetical protein